MKSLQGLTGRFLISAMSFALVLGLISPAGPAVEAAADETKTTNVKLDPSYQHDPFDGWGTALVWFANCDRRLAR